MASRSESLFTTVRSLPNNNGVVERFKRSNLTIGFVKWEDTARDKGSCWGPNISDVTLDVDDKSFPIIGTENFKDQTHDMPISRFSVNVGNEKSSVDTGESMRHISFKEYLENLSQYVSATVKGSMYLPRDDKILTSSQCCILPLNSGKVPFNVRIHNYQYDNDDPAVLVVVVSPHGTSAQLLTDYKQKVYFNKCGKKAPYVAERLSDVRVAAGRSTQGDMTQEEKEHNVLFVFQIPLKHKERSNFYECGANFSGSMPKCVSQNNIVRERGEIRSARGMDNAQLSVGDSVGPWTGTSSKFTIERDARYPIRCTIQYYRVTDSDTIPDNLIDDISQQILKFYNEAPMAEKGSLVTNPASGRLTEPNLPAKPVMNKPFFNF